MEHIKIAYIGGGSKLWARTFMNDLALSIGLCGEIGLYDIDMEQALINQKIGMHVNELKVCKSKFDYKAYDNIDACLKDATFVVLSILPGTFKEMHSDVHAPEKYGIYQSVGDTVGPGGILRAMRTVPIYEYFAQKIKEICPNAWVLNFTNPMSICVKTLYDVFPEIKAFGCCHEVFHAQEFLCLILRKIKNIDIKRTDIYTDASGINHFTWITEAYYKDIDILSLIPEFMDKYYEDGYYEYKDRFEWKNDYFAYGNKVKMDMFRRYGALGAAGDRHLAEFMDHDLYLKDPKTVEDYCFRLTPVSWRIENQKNKVEEALRLANKEEEFILAPSGEEAVDLMKAILGHKRIVSNVNMPNLGQVVGLPLGSIVESNCLFSANSVKPIMAKPLPEEALKLVRLNCDNIDLCYQGIKQRNLDIIFEAFKNQPLCSKLSPNDALSLFKEMVYNTKEYLNIYFNLDTFLDEM